MRRAEQKLISEILNCGVFKSGDVFPVHEVQRGLQHRDGDYGASRVREILNVMVEQGKADKVQAPNGEMYYRRSSESRALLSRLWANPVSTEYSPRWC